MRTTTLIQTLLRQRASGLLLFTLLSLLPNSAESLGPYRAVLLFVVCGLGLLPLAIMLSQLVEQLAARLGDRLGGLLSVTLGNMVELVVGISALRSGLYSLVVVSVGGAVLTNCLLVLGISILVGCGRRSSTPIHPHSTELQTQLLLISVLVLFVPALFTSPAGRLLTAGDGHADALAFYSVSVALLVLISYLGSFVYQMGTHRQLFLRPAGASASEAESSSAPLPTLVAVLVLITALLVAVSDRLVDALEALVQGAHLSPLFVGLFLLPLFGSLPEALVAVQAARRRNMDLAMSGTVDSSVQLLLFVLPTLVLIGLPIGRHLHLAFPQEPLAALAGTVLVLQGITQNRRLIWYEGVQLLLLYLVLALGALLLTRPG